MHRRTFLSLTLVSSAVAAFAGCAPSTGSSAGAKSAGASGAGAGTVKMVLWPGPEGDAMSKVVDQYNAGQGAKDNIKVELTLLSRQDTFSKEATLMAAKSGDQDIYFTASYNVGQFVASLDALDGIDASNYFPVAVDGLKFQGKSYALPLDVSNHFLYYRKDLLDELLKDKSAATKYSAVAQLATGKALTPTDPANWSWDDYKAMSAWFTKAANPASPTEYGTILQAKNLPYNTMIGNDVLWGLGGSWTDSAGKATMDTAQGMAAVQLYTDVYKKGWTSPDASQAEFPETQAALKSGNTFCAIQWSAGFAELNDPAKSPKVAGKIAIAHVPGHKTHVHALAVSLNKYSTNKDASKKFLAYLATPEAMIAYATAGGIPAMPSVLSAKQSLNPAFEKIGESIKSYGYAEPVFPKAFQAYTTLAADLSGAWVGQGAASDAIKKANTDLAGLLA